MRWDCMAGTEDSATLHDGWGMGGVYRQYTHIAWQARMGVQGGMFADARCLMLRRSLGLLVVDMPR